jgi:predicted TIM-barrel fold metal-dependent hydrolase
MIIDVHAHWGPWMFTRTRPPRTPPPPPSAWTAELLAAMDRYGIDRAIASSSEAVIHDAPAGNRALAEALDSEERLHGYIALNPRRLDAAARDLTAYLPGGRFIGVKIHTDYSASPVSSPQLRRALELVAAAGCPALVHTWGASVLELAHLVVQIPGLKVIAGHMGADGHRHAIEAASVCDRLYLEPCWSHAPAGRFAEVAAAVNPRQLLFGTDATLIDPASAFGAVAGAKLSDDLAERIAWRNAAELFGLDGLDGP